MYKILENTKHTKLKFARVNTRVNIGLQRNTLWVLQLQLNTIREIIKMKIILLCNLIYYAIL